MTIQDKLTELQRLAEAATPGKWFQSLGTIVGTDDVFVAELVCDQHYNKRVDQINADGRLISASRTAMPQLVEALRVATEYLDVMRDNRPKEQVWFFAESALTRIAGILEVGG